MMYKGTVLPFVVVATAFLAGIIYFFVNIVPKNSQVVQEPTPVVTPDQYSGWNTYKNSAYNFSLRYPANWNFKENQGHLVEFFPPETGEASGGASLKFIASADALDKKEFEKVYKLEEGSQFAEPLDVRSQVTKTKNSQVGAYKATEYYTDRAFSAMEGPKGEYSHHFTVELDNLVLKFVSSSVNREEQLRFNDPTFEAVIKSLLIDSHGP